MDSASRTRNNKYDRVMSRVNNQSSSSLKSSSFVTRHDIPSSVRVGAKSVTSNVSFSGVLNELPTFLNDYVAEPTREKVIRTHVVKPRRTIKSLDVAASPLRTTKQRELIKKPSNIRAQESAPSVLINNGERWSTTHLRECMSSRSHSRLKDLKDEIKAYKEADKLMRLRSSLFKKCGVVLDDVGNVTEDKAVQAKLTEEVEVVEEDTGQATNRFRYPNEYTAPPDGTLLPEDLPDDMYENLIDERPELEPILSPSRKTKVRRPKMYKMIVPSESAVYHKFEFPRVHREDEEDEDDYEHGDGDQAGKTVRYADRLKLAQNSNDSTTAAPSSHKLPVLLRNQTRNDSRKFWLHDISIEEWENPPWDSSPIVATCYTCGGNYDYIPNNPLCHDMFESEDWRARTMRRFFRSTCHFNMKWAKTGMTKKQEFHKYGIITQSESLKTARLGDFLPGCYKRFLDIGTVYTSRGCRMMWPHSRYVGGAAASRFGQLERLLRWYTDQCITSSHASLTPFSRGISLFARYHVCVCPGKYCNSATVPSAYRISLLLISLIFVALFNFMNNV